MQILVSVRDSGNTALSTIHFLLSSLDFLRSQSGIVLGFLRGIMMFHYLEEHVMAKLNSQLFLGELRMLANIQNEWHTKTVLSKNNTSGRQLVPYK